MGYFAAMLKALQDIGKALTAIATELKGINLAIHDNTDGVHSALKEINGTLVKMLETGPKVVGIDVQPGQETNHPVK